MASLDLGNLSEEQQIALAIQESLQDTSRTTGNISSRGRRTLFIFNDNEEHYNSAIPGGNNAVIRQYNQFGSFKGDEMSAGIPTGSFSSGGYTHLNHRNARYIDIAINNIDILLSTGRYDSIKYSAVENKNKAELGTGIFKVGHEVKKYIVDEIYRLANKYRIRVIPSVFYRGDNNTDFNYLIQEFIKNRARNSGGASGGGASGGGASGGGASGRKEVISISSKERENYENLIKKMELNLPKIMDELISYGKKTGHWSWWVWPTEKSGVAEPAPKTSVSLNTAKMLLDNPPNYWRAVLQYICQLIKNNDNSFYGIIPQVDWGRINYFVILFDKITNKPSWFNDIIECYRVALKNIGYQFGGNKKSKKGVVKKNKTMNKSMNKSMKKNIKKSKKRKDKTRKIKQKKVKKN